MANTNWTPKQQKIADLDAVWGEAATKALKQGATEADFKTVTDLYSKDGTVAWQGFKPGHGSAEIEAHWKKANKSFRNSVLKFEPVRLDIVGSLALDFGKVVFKSPAPDSKQSTAKYKQSTAKYLVIWRREGRSWKVLYDAWNENTSS